METKAYNFDEVINRKGTQCEKWDGLERHFGRADLLPMWVADMDFASPAPVTQAIVQRAQHGVFGYTGDAQADRCAVTDWLAARHGLEVAPECLLWTGGVVDSIRLCVQALTRPGDGVVIQPPVYGPFFSVPRQLGRELVMAPLARAAGNYTMDLETLEAAFATGAKLWILCNPHNPVGRVWTREELAQALKLADQYGVTVVSDEIHADFIYTGHRHAPILSLPHGRRHIMLISATKTFNLAGLKHSTMIIADEALRAHIDGFMERHGGQDVNNIFGLAAQRAAYTQCAPWLQALLVYLQSNRDYAYERLSAMPGVRPTRPEGTYLMWIDMRGLSLSPAELKRFWVEDAGLALSDGLGFGEQGERWARLNFACPRAQLAQALSQLEGAIRARGDK